MANKGALRFFGVMDVNESVSEHAQSFLTEGVAVVRFRDLGAVVAPAPYERVRPSDADIQEYVRVVDHLSEHGPVIPAPPGTVFRGEHVLRGWLEVHYAKLHETLGVIERRGVHTAPYDLVRMDFGG
jgi:hypothetical protein